MLNAYFLDSYNMYIYIPNIMMYEFMVYRIYTFFLLCMNKIDIIYCSYIIIYSYSFVVETEK